MLVRYRQLVGTFPRLSYHANAFSGSRTDADRRAGGQTDRRTDTDRRYEANNGALQNLVVNAFKNKTAVRNETFERNWFPIRRTDFLSPERE
jgi:hypothetical protein